ncbi:hypothetical protein Lbir_1614 [Legionella birminghamensis]|uniref:Ankyrin repeats (3 copies) n=1 Tax=Legionella birminghamensis TaxID=28083 RepID=A0A378IJS6_9GAMM|nr:ankyrin repeat domain-containing protein [Legionella birminghamensis]KTC71759.1 hypothetical protein Lbir_1614 [Legionella birminghamensis]STX32404.1 Uncharacterised protein [Legionella birminghamensis]
MLPYLVVDRLKKHVKERDLNSLEAAFRKYPIDFSVKESKSNHSFCPCLFNPRYLPERAYPILGYELLILACEQLTGENDYKQKACIDIIKLLLAHGASAWSGSRKTFDPVYYAATRNAAEVLGDFLKQIPIFGFNENDRQALRIAESKGYTQVVKQFAYHKVEKKLGGQNGFDLGLGTAFALAAMVAVFAKLASHMPAEENIYMSLI